MLRQYTRTVYSVVTCGTIAYIASFPGLPVSYSAAEKAGKPGDEANNNILHVYYTTKVHFIKTCFIGQQTVPHSRLVKHGYRHMHGYVHTERTSCVENSLSQVMGLHQLIWLWRRVPMKIERISYNYYIQIPNTITGYLLHTTCY